MIVFFFLNFVLQFQQLGRVWFFAKIRRKTFSMFFPLHTKLCSADTIESLCFPHKPGHSTRKRQTELAAAWRRCLQRLQTKQASLSSGAAESASRRNQKHSGHTSRGASRRKVIDQRCRTQMKPLPAFVVWDQNRLEVQVWQNHRLDPVSHWVQLRNKEVRLFGQI